MRRPHQHRALRAPRVPTAEPDASVVLSPRMLIRLGRATEQTIVEMIAAHVRNWHDRGPLAFDGWALVEQLRTDVEFRRAVMTLLREVEP